ncbi:hypothetical protein SLS56_007069 [Neofusicoccum ribis]|uniref:Uncharacterized protein n=1 Tax=Neofusicoccum ribis TaxID=45134 RepID=A0ABR3SPY7_9PEZI
MAAIDCIQDSRQIHDVENEGCQRSESVKDFGKTGHWLMLGKDFEEGSRDVVQPREPDDLSEFQRSRIRNHFMGRGTSSPYRVWTHRTKSTIQRCVGTLKYDSNGRTAYRPIFASLWVVILTIAVLALICFYGVGIIATSTTFDPTFQKYFFWIAIIWSLASSSLLGWIIMIFGGNKRDVVAALISGLGIWLVIIQIGQTYLLTQLGIN